MYKSIVECRICKSGELTNVLSLGKQALTGVFPASPSENVGAGPVDIVMCTGLRGCNLVQLLQSYEPSEMYGDNYGYRSGLNKSMVEHLEGKVSKILEMGILEEGDVVVDIGSNDATTLKTYPKGVYKLFGIDPTGRKFSSYYPAEINLVADFFTAESFTRHVGDCKAKVVTSFSMFYDLEDPVSFAKDISSILHNKGIWVLEQSYLPTMLMTNSFDTICHEHLEFYGLKQIEWIAEVAGLKVLDVEFNDINGGSFSIIISKIDSPHHVNIKKIQKILSDELALGLDSPECFIDFRARMDEAGSALMTFLNDAKTAGKRVSGLGASTKGNVLLQYLGIGPSLVSEIAEVNIEKWGKYTPGTGIPIKSEDEVLALNPDYLLVLPWHFRRFLLGLDKLKGQKLIFPLPKFEIVEL